MAFETLKACPGCAGKNIEKYIDLKDYSVTGETFTIDECKDCGLKFTNPRPDENSIGKYYQSEDYISHSDSNKGLINKLYHLVRSRTIKSKLSLVNSLADKSRILDVGCGTGYFLKACKENGWKIDGTEPDDKARKLAEQQLNNSIHNSIFSVEGRGSYGVITLWHVLEHIHLLKESLIKVNVLLKEKGKLVIAVPNPESLDAKSYKEHWAAYDVPRHLYHFNQKSMEILLHNNGFKIIKKKPMVYDSYYVSMLSEKLKSKNNKTNLLPAFITGLKSNISARFNKKNYSSIIYIAEKTN